MKERIIIAGGGFAGLSALRTFSGYGDRFEVMLIDRRRDQEFLPLLPDVIGKGFLPQDMRVSLAEECERCGAMFHEEEIIAFLPDKSRVVTTAGDYVYSYLIICMGTVTNFYGNNSLLRKSHELKSLNSAQLLRDAAVNGPEENIVVCGGGYTGVEAVSALWLALRNAGRYKKLTIVNLASRLCPALPENFSSYIDKELRALDIIIENNNTVQEAEGNSLTLKNGRVIGNALLVWVAGVKAPECVTRISHDPTAQGRLNVDECLMFSQKIFVAGDCAAFSHNDNVLRMSVQNALAEGALAASNIIRLSKNKPPKAYKPFDPGYVVPLASGRSCGNIMGFRFFGRIPTWMHYLVCSLRSSTFKNGLGVFRQWLKK